MIYCMREATVGWMDGGAQFSCCSSGILCSLSEHTDYYYVQMLYECRCRLLAATGLLMMICHQPDGICMRQCFTAFVLHIRMREVWGIMAWYQIRWENESPMLKLIYALYCICTCIV